MKCLCGLSMAKTHDYNHEGYEFVWNCHGEPRCKVLCFTNGDGVKPYMLADGTIFGSPFTTVDYHVRRSHRIPADVLCVWGEVEI